MLLVGQRLFFELFLLLGQSWAASTGLGPDLFTLDEKYIIDKVKETLLSSDPDFGKDLDHLVRSKGYPFESHRIVTHDGYVLHIHRVPYGKGKGVSNIGPPVLIGCPLLCSSACWLFDMPDFGQGFLLADADFDVWIANIRGNNYGTKHVNHSTSDKEFWDFSLVDSGRYDYPAMIDYILQATGYSKIFFSGMQQAAASIFMTLSLRPEYNDKIHIMALQAPFRSLRRTKWPGARRAASIKRHIEQAAQTLKIYKAGQTVEILAQLCKIKQLHTSCVQLGDVALGFGKEYINQTRIAVYLQHVPAGTSLENFKYLGQLVADTKGEIPLFDYGEQLNMKKYKSSTPPRQDASKIRVPMALYSSKGDLLTTFEEAKDVEMAFGDLVRKHYEIDDPNFTHFCFILNKNNVSHYHDMIEFFRSNPIGSNGDDVAMDVKVSIAEDVGADNETTESVSET